MEVRRKLEAVTMNTRKVRDQIVALKPKTLHQVLGRGGVAGRLEECKCDPNLQERSKVREL